MTDRDSWQHGRYTGSAEQDSGSGARSQAPDLSQVQADDALLDALGGSDPKVADGLGDQELNALLLAWRRDIDSQPLGELVDTETAVATVKTATLAKSKKAGGQRRRFLVPVAAAAAVLAIAFTGTGLAARDAQPGDMLWGLTKVLYADQAKSIEAAATVRLELDEAEAALTSGHYEQARMKLEEARRALEQVSTEEERARLNAEHRALALRLGEHPPAGGDPQPPSPGKSGNPGSEKPSGNQPGPPPQTNPSELKPDTSLSPTPPPTTSSPPTTSTPTGENSGSESGSSPRYDTPNNVEQAPPAN